MPGFKRSHLRFTAVVIALVAGQGCAFATYQDAKTLGKGNWEFTPTVTRLGFYEDGDSEGVGNAFGGMVTAGVSDRIDVGAAYVRFEPRELERGANFIGLGPKISLTRDRAALVLPVSFAFGEDVDVSDTLQFSPGVVFSTPLGTRATFNPAARIVFTNCDGCDVLVGANAGFTVPLGSGRFILRPDAGILFDPGESGFMWTFGLGLSLRPR